MAVGHIGNPPFLKHNDMAPSKKPAAKSGDKPKDKGKGSASKDDNAGGSKLKAATAINTRHILVRSVLLLSSYLQCGQD